MFPKTSGRVAAAVIGALVLSLPACQTVPVNPSDSTAPSIAIKVRAADGQYYPQTSVNFDGTPLEVVAVVDDPQGVKAISLTYINTTAQSCYVAGASYNGSFPITVPQPLNHTLTGSSGKVLTKLPMLTTISGPFTCKILGGQTGSPVGHTLRLRATGTNWASSPGAATASAQLDIKL